MSDVRREDEPAAQGHTAPGTGAGPAPRLLVSASEFGVMTIDSEGRIRSADPTAASLLAHHAGRPVGLAIGTPTPVDGTLEIDLVQRDGAVHAVELRLSTTTWQGRRLSVGALHERAPAREPDAGLARQYIAMALIAQELDKPLIAIAAALRPLRDGEVPTDAHQAELIDVIDERVEQLRGLVGRLGSAAIAATDRENPAPEPIRVFESLLERLDELHEKSRNVRLRCDAGLMVFVGRIEFAHMLDSYLHQALRAGGAPVDLDVTQQGEWVDIRIRDSGVRDAGTGLFDRYAPGENEDGDADSPLWITRSLARLYGGDAWYDSSPEGTCFHLRLPAPTR